MNEVELNNIFVRLSKEYGMNPSYLRQIIPHRNAGFNNSQIAEMTGISRVTVNTYVDKMEQFEKEDDFRKLILLGLGLYVGYQILKDLFGDNK